MGYTSFPTVCEREQSRNYEFRNGLRSGYARHLLSGDLSKIAGVKQPSVALHHFSPYILAENSKQKAKSNFITKVNLELGRLVGLRDIDRVPNANLYYALPNYSWENTLFYVYQIESDAVVNGAEINLTSRMSSAKKREMRAIEDARKKSAK